MDFSDYVSARGPALERFAHVLTGDAHQAQDLVQIALLKAYRRWRWVARAEHPDAYVRRIVTTSYLDWRRRRSSAEQPVAALPDRPGGPDPGDRVADRDELRRALATLSPRQRAVLVLRHYEGWDDAAIAAALRCGEAAVRTHASRGRQRLGAALGLVSPPAEVPRAEAPAAGVPRAGVPAAGVPAAGVPRAGVPAAGVPAAGVAPAGGPAAEVPPAGVPAADGPAPDPTTVSEGPR